MHSSGNDYIYVINVKHPLANPAELSARWSARHTGIGADGLVLIGASAVADFSMRMFNADGSEALMCGNASICVRKFVYDKKLTRKSVVMLETLSGVKEMRLDVVGDSVNNVTVNMGRTRLHDLRTTLQCGALTFVGAVVSMGNPHFVTFVEDAGEVDLSTVGPLIEHHLTFPNRTNVEYAHLCADGAIRMQVWERDSGVTQGCGSGACATAVAAIAQGLAPHDVRVQMGGGSLQVQWDGEGSDAYIAGLAVSVFEGVIAL